MFPFKVPLFQGCKSETEPVNTKSVLQHIYIKYCWRHIKKPILSIVAVVQPVCLVTLSTSLHTHTHTRTSAVCIRYEVLLAAYYKADTKYCWCRATCLSGHIVDFTTHSHTHTHTHTHINRLYTIPSIVGGILQSVLNFIHLINNL
jgi:hypothetical protein